MPFTAEEFFDVFAQYNAQIWPLQIATYALGLMIVGLLFWRNRGAGILISTTLAFFWAINAAGYHWSHFSAINPAAYIFGAFFVVQAELLAIAPLIFGGLQFTVGRNTRSVTGLLLVAFAMAGFPLWEWAAGHTYPAVPVFGVAPFPTTLFTIGILLLAPWKKARWLLIIPALWGAVGGSAAIFLKLPQDMELSSALFVIGLIAALVILGIFAIGRWEGKALSRPVDDPGVSERRAE